MHKQLAQHLKTLNLSPDSPPDEDSWQALIDAINDGYTRADYDRVALEHSLEVSAEEMQSLYNRLKASYEMRQSAILRAFPDLLFLLDEDGLYLEVMAQNDASLVRPESELKGQTLAQTFSADKADFFMQVIQQVLSSGQPQTIEYELEVQAGLASFEGRMISAGYSVDGKKTVLYLARDITEKKRNERRQKLLNTVMASATEGIVIVRADKKVLYVNSAVEKITGFSEAELVNEGEGFLRHELDLDMCDDLCRAACAGDHLKRELVIHSKQGQASDILLSMDTLRDDNGEIEYFVGILTDISQQKEARRQIEHMATHDVLTGLPNRHLFEQRMQQMLSQAVRTQTMGALFFLDLDRFKSINDTLGHSFGDRLLIEVADRLQSVCHRADIVARFGGDEFVILVQQVETEQQAAQMAQKILALFDQKINQQQYELKISTSIGIVLFPGHGVDTEHLIKQADVAMYEAKKGGRNQYKFFAQQYLESAIAGMTMEQEMLQALEREEFFLEYQPQYTLSDQGVCGFEALIRWQHPLHGRVSPADFIPVAESSGLIDGIGLWVFRQVCQQVVRWSEQGLAFGRIAFNLSQRQLMDANLAQIFIEEMQRSGAIKHAEQIEFEITESLIIKQIDIALNTIEQLKATGMKLAIDDFGTGHSSLVNLKRYPLDRLKIDRGFVNDIGKDQNDEAIIKASVTLAQGFGLQVIAEGVENELQKNFLIEVGCDEVQGYLYNKPLPLEQAEALLTGVKVEK